MEDWGSPKVSWGVRRLHSSCYYCNRLCLELLYNLTHLCLPVPPSVYLTSFTQASFIHFSKPELKSFLKSLPAPSGACYNDEGEGLGSL